MMMNEPRNYSMTHVRRCFPEFGNPVVQDWIKRGYLSCGKDEQGTRRTVFTFNWPEITLVGIVGQLSTYGVLRGAAVFSALFDDLDEARNFGGIYITMPEKILEYCTLRDFNVGVLITPEPKGKPVVVSALDQRVKTAQILFRVEFQPIGQLQRRLSQWAEREMSWGVSLACVNVLRIVHHVKSVLEIPGD